MTDEPLPVGVPRFSGPEPESRVRVPSHVVHRAFSGETVVLNLQTGQYHGLNGSAGAMFSVLSAGEPFAVGVNRIAEQYGIPHATAERDLARLCASLLERGLVDSVA